LKKIVPDLYKTTKIWGPPGTGKTTQLLKILKERLDYGYSKADVCLVGYARATATTLQDRCKNEFNFKEEELESIRTIHSLCKNALPKELQLLTSSDKKYLNRILNWPKSDWATLEQYRQQIRKEDDPEDDNDDEERKQDERERRKFLENKLEVIGKGLNTCTYGNSWRSIKHYFEELQENYQYNNIHLDDLEFTYNTYKDFKKAYGIIDFTDMLSLTLEPNIILPNYEILFVDECQDLNPLMWRVLDKMFEGRGNKQIYLAGDDDQSIYGFNCADPDTFLHREATQPDIILPKSYRLPKKIKDFSQSIITEINPKFRKEKEFTPKTKFLNGRDTGEIVQGEIIDIFELEDIAKDLSKEDWIMCARTGAWTFNFKKHLVEKNILWKSKGPVGRGRDFNYSIKDKVVTVLKTWEDLKKGFTVDGGQICDLIQLTSAKFLKAIKKEHLKGKSKAFSSDLSYGRNDVLTKNIFKKDFSFDKDWFNFIFFKQKHVSEASKARKGTAVHLFSDNEEVQNYIIEVWKKDPTLRKSSITVGTIHSVKGREATNVVVCDVWSSLCMGNFKNSTPFFRREEIRCAYVAVTRSKRTLYMYRPACNSKYEDHFPLLEREKYDRT
jgi:DNA helicase-2/ATP-dependent DNA helicase PcrA|tara:strand:- start:2329 stop:4167 length:1839 start_codon:yes stop_codon:yes gene_type:complete